jgi:hypothetical protein
MHRWICKTCARLNKLPFESFNGNGLQNPHEHLWRDHNIGAPAGEKKKSVAQLHNENDP